MRHGHAGQTCNPSKGKIDPKYLEKIQTAPRTLVTVEESVTNYTFNNYYKANSKSNEKKDSEKISYSSNPDEIKKWMNKWMGGVRTVSGSFNLRRFKDPIYILMSEINWKPNEGQEQYPKVTVPKGFVTDFASIPSIFHSILKPDDEYAFAAVIHDYMYWHQQQKREEADKIFEIAMQDLDIDELKVFAIISVVRLGGWIAWDENYRLKKSGEKRILKKFHQDPKITWEEWKTRSNVFLNE